MGLRVAENIQFYLLNWCSCQSKIQKKKTKIYHSRSCSDVGFRIKCAERLNESNKEQNKKRKKVSNYLTFRFSAILFDSSAGNWREELIENCYFSFRHNELLLLVLVGNLKTPPSYRVRGNGVWDGTSCVFYFPFFIFFFFSIFKAANESWNRTLPNKAITNRLTIN